MRSRGSIRLATARAANTLSSGGPCDTAGRRSAAVARLWAWLRSRSRRDPPAVELAGRGLRGRMEVPVPAPRGAVEHAATPAGHLRMLNRRLLHMVLRTLAGESSLHSNNSLK